MVTMIFKVTWRADIHTHKSLLLSSAKHIPKDYMSIVYVT